MWAVDKLRANVSNGVTAKFWKVNNNNEDKSSQIKSKLTSVTPPEASVLPSLLNSECNDAMPHLWTLTLERGYLH